MKKTINIIKISALIIGIAIIVYALHIMVAGNWGVFVSVGKPLFKALLYCIPFLIQLFIWSLAYIWPPIAVYIIISFITVSKSWRFFLGVVALCAFFVFVYYAYLKDFKISSIHYFLMAVMQIYLLALWVIPKELWNLISGAVWMVGSLIVTIFPDLPTYFDDLGMIFGLFIFVFIYLHSIALIIQRIVDEKIIIRIRKIFRKQEDNLSDFNME